MTEWTCISTKAVKGEEPDHSTSYHALWAVKGIQRLFYRHDQCHNWDGYILGLMVSWKEGKHTN